MKSKFFTLEYFFVSILFLLVLWGAPYPFYTATSELFRRSAAVSLSGVLNIKAILQITIWIVFFCVVYLGIFKRNIRQSLNLNKDDSIYKSWLIFIICACIAQLFSYSFLLSGLRLFQLITLFLFLLSMLNGNSYDQGLPQRVFVVFILTNFAYNLLMYVFYPDAVVWRTYVGLDRLIGGWLFQKDYGLCSVFLYCFALANLFFYKKNKATILLVLLSSAGILLGGTRSFAIAAFLLLIVTLYIRFSNKNFRGIVLVLGLFSLGLSLYLFPQINELMGRSHDSLLSGSGRFTAWGLFWYEFWGNSNWFFGNGYSAAGRTIATTHYSGAFGNMHNMYLEVLVDTGVFGLVAFFYIIITTLRTWFSCTEFLIKRKHDRVIIRNIVAWGLIFIALLIIGVTANSFMEEFFISTFAFIMASFYIQYISKVCRKINRNYC